MPAQGEKGVGFFWLFKLSRLQPRNLLLFLCLAEFLGLLIWYLTNLFFLFFFCSFYSAVSIDFDFALLRGAWHDQNKQLSLLMNNSDSDKHLEKTDNASNNIIKLMKVAKSDIDML